MPVSTTDVFPLLVRNKAKQKNQQPKKQNNTEFLLAQADLQLILLLRMT